ncbi:YdbH domain-containing protein [Stutzerimonas stutzeri]|uniref:YdbH domain-containing protein n=1 Tax=Stutzerimonas stutzeri TaxID=316 RepID=UPI001C2E522C|nr:YdbH domain-containing protein [Stutzerimonas stutzeri]
MTRLRRTLLFTALGVLVTCLLLAFYAAIRWDAFKEQQGIVAFDVDGVRLSTNGIGLRQFALTQQRADGERLTVLIDDLQLPVDSWRHPLPLGALRVAQARIEWQPAKEREPDVASPSLPDRQQLQRWAAWVPRDGLIDSLTLELPCASGRCLETGQVSWRHAGQAILPAELQLDLQHGDRRLQLTAEAREQAADTLLDLRLLLDGEPRLTMQNQFTPGSGLTRWRGALSSTELPEAPWLLDWLADWVDYTPPELPELPEQMRIGGAWDLSIDPATIVEDFRVQAGELRLSANLPAPWPVPGIGQMQGRLDLGARVEGGIWIPTELAADLNLLPVAERVAVLPERLRPSAISLKITPSSADGATPALPLSLQLAASGPAPLTLNSRLLVETRAPYLATFSDTRLTLRSPVFAGPAFSLKGLEADLRLGGTLSQQAATIRLDKGSRVTVDSLAAAEVTASRLLAELGGTSVEVSVVDGQLEHFAVTGKPALKIGELKQPALRPQAWRWSGRIKAEPSGVSLDGPLSNDAGLALPMTLHYDPASGATRLDAVLPELFLRAGNPLAATLVDWPQVLELNNGRLQGKARVEVPPSGPLAVSASLTAKGVGGIYDRTELSGLDAALSLTLQRDQLRLDLNELTVREVNPGFTFGPLHLVGEFLGPLDEPTQGRLSWREAEVRLLGGRLWLDPRAIDLAASSQRLNAHLRGLQLPLLLEAYPTEGLSGTGVIDGELEVQRSAAGISVEKGSLQAREPGGALQFRSAKIQALGQANPAMRLVTEALDDFHYSLLASDVHYSADGKLDLGLRLQGRNPALEGGRPINFSINLEEDIPALLTSLQLSDRVSETIQRRVQERLRSGTVTRP